jgi:mercuric reductase
MSAEDKVKFKSDFDLIVLGAGSAGFSAAITASKAGKTVALVGHGLIGGTCVNVGCVPSKALIRAAESMHSEAISKRFAGIEVATRLTSYRANAEQRDRLVDTLRAEKYVGLLPEYENVTYFDAVEPAVLGDRQVFFDSKTLRAPMVVIATGTRPQVPDLDGLDVTPFSNSTTLLARKDLPKSLIFIGGGYIAVELAQAMRRMGAKVTILARSGLLSRVEPEISKALTEVLTAEGIDVIVGAARRVESTADGNVTVTYDAHGKEGHATAGDIVITTGRTANTESLGLDIIGVATGRNGSVLVDDHMRTNLEWLYGAGDVIGENEFVYMAALEGKIAATNAVGDEDMSVHGTVVPWVVFCEPQIAGVGISEAQAIEAGHEVVTSILPMSKVPRAIAGRDTRGLVKLVADKETRRLLGGQIIAPEGGDVIQTLTVLIQVGSTYKDLAETIFPYLTSVESLKLAGQGFTQDIAKLSCCAG